MNTPAGEESLRASGLQNISEHLGVIPIQAKDTAVGCFSAGGLGGGRIELTLPMLESWAFSRRVHATLPSLEGVTDPHKQ